MARLLDLNDDAITAYLSFTDPPSLSTATMTCRRMRRLADAAWEELDKEIDDQKREGGDTPRERVLSSFAVHKDRERMANIARQVERYGSNIIGKGIVVATPEELDTDNFLLYFFASWGFSHRKTLVDAWLKVTGAQRNSLVNGGPVDLPLNMCAIQGNFHTLVSSLYGGPGTFSQRNISPGFQYETFGWGFLNYKTATELDDFLHTCEAMKISILTVNRRTLTPAIFCVGTAELRSDHNILRNSIVRLGIGSYRLESSASLSWVANYPSLTKKISFYFQNDSFGVKINC